jgi:hypothetical protein
MVSLAKIAANRRNSLRSTGPRSAAGKARTRYNALQHGLTIPISHDQSTAALIGDLANRLCDSDDEDERERDLALRAAEAELETLRVRRAGVDLVNRAAARLRGAELHFLPDDERAALAFAANCKTLAAFDRYERRAIAKRNRALCQLRVMQAPRFKNPIEEVGPRLPKRPRRRSIVFEQQFVAMGVNVTRSMASIPPGSNVRCTFGLPPSSFGDWSVTNFSGRIQVAGDQGMFELSFDVPDEKNVTQRFALTHVPSGVGHGHWFVRCPATQKRVRVLYLMRWQRQFHSRHALGLTYSSQLLNSSELLHQRGLRLVQRIGGRSDASGFSMDDVPPRPKGMHRMTYYDIREETKKAWHRCTCAHLGWTLPWDDPDWPSIKDPPKVRTRSKVAEANRQIVKEAREAEAAYRKLL